MKYALANVPIRPHFTEFVEYCAGQQIELAVVSGGLNFYIEALLPHPCYPFIRILAEYNTIFGG